MKIIKQELQFEESLKQRLEFSIFNCAYTCKEILDSLPLNRNKEILENIINLGMMDKYLGVLNNTRENKRSDKL